MAKHINNETLNIPVIRGKVLGVTVLRGYARLNDLAKVSKADVYDKVKNPTGTQRDLSPKHARAAYEYVKDKDFAFWPEVFLCTRDNEVITYIPSDLDEDFGTLHIDVKDASKKGKISISRVDGNHRLYFADGSQEGYAPIEKIVSFCLAYNLTREEEITLFRDINANQKAMNTSHLDNIHARLTPEDELKRDDPDLYIARLLGRDSESPLYDRVYEGGKKPAGFSISLRTLRTGIKYMLSRPTKLTALRDPDAQYKVIRNYFIALQMWEPSAWDSPSKYILLRGAGLWGACFIGADVIDRALSQAKFKPDDMLIILQSGKDWDWSNKGDFQGYSGRGGAVQISDKVTSELQDESGISVSSLYQRIMQEE